MKQKILEIALASFLHDIGKFIQRVSDDGGVHLPDDFPAALYQPKNRNGIGFSHIHASYTALFIKDKLKCLPEIADMEYFINLAAKHHLSGNSAEEYIITVADRLSAGMDRKNFEDDNAEEINYSQYCKTRLISIFEELGNDITDYEHRNFQYDLSPFTGENIFPVHKNENAADYTTLASGFINDLDNISAGNLKDWFLQFDDVAKKWISFVPSATVKKIIPDVSLYDHAKTASALAQALYVYHMEEEGDLVKNHIKDNSGKKKFLYFKAKFNGIQNFIFSVGGETNKNAAKLLRGRSFYISLLMKKFAAGLCDYLGLAHTAVIISAAGSITAVLPNTSQTLQKLNEFENLANNWLIEQFYGEASISCAYVETTGDALIDELKDLGNMLANKLEVAKFHKLPLEKLGVVKHYFNKGEQPCVFCGKRPSINTAGKCSICEDLVEIGAILSKSIRKPYILKNKIFGIFDRVDIGDYDNLYVPHRENGETKTFEEIASGGESADKMAALGVLKADIDNLGFLLDKVASGLGQTEKVVYSRGLARQVEFSRMLNAFWVEWLPISLRTQPEYQDIYTLFAGGDDLFLIGKWNTIIDFAFFLREQFKQYTCNNPGITLSAGIAVLKPGNVISKFYDLSEKALESSKEYDDGRGNLKNALTLFGETIPWSKQNELTACYNDIEELIVNKKINFGGLSKLMEFIDMAAFSDEAAQKLAKNDSISYKDMQNFKWRALLTYFIVHNEEIKKSDEKQSRIEQFIRQIENSEKRSILKTMLWKNIYENRRRN